MINKRGVSPVIATVLIILVTIAAAGIIAGIAVPFVRDGLDKSTECLEFKEYYNFEKSIEFNNTEYRYNCVKTVPVSGESVNRYGFSVRANTVNKKDNLSDKLGGFNVVLYTEDGKSEVISVDENYDNVIESEGIPLEGEIKTYYYDSDEFFINMEVYSRLNGGRVCELSDEIKISLCNENIDFVNGENDGS